MWEFLPIDKCYRPGRSVIRPSKSSSLHLKKIFLVGVCGFFVSDVISGGLSGHLGPGRQPLDGSISLKFLLETRLQSKSSDTLDDLLGFQVQKL